MVCPGLFFSSCSSRCLRASSYRYYPLLPLWEAHFSVGVLSMVRFMLPCMLEAGLFFYTTLYVTVLYWSDRTSMNFPIHSNPHLLNNIQGCLFGTRLSTPWLFSEHVSGSLKCASIAFTEEAVINAAGCARLHDEGTCLLAPPRASCYLTLSRPTSCSLPLPALV
jgi:hypothetical protein